MELDIKNMLLTLVVRRRLIVLTILGFFVAGLVLSLVTPRRYRSIAKILPPPQDETTFGSSIISSLQQQFGMQVSGLAGLQTPFDLFIGILKSNTIALRVVKSCDLKKAYRVKSEGKALGILTRQVGFKPLPEGVLMVSVETRSGGLSATIANSYLTELDRFLKETNMTRGRNTRLFVERRLHEVENNLRLAEDSMRAFQQRNKTVALEDETKNAVQQYAQLKAQAIAKQTELAVMQSYATADNPLYQSAKNEGDELERRLKDLEAGGASTGFGVGFGVSFANMPKVGAEYLRRLRDVKIQEEIYVLLVQQYEQAKILEARDTPTVIVLEAAAPNRIPSWPKKGIVIALFTVLGLVVGILAAFAGEWWTRIKNRPEEYGEFRRIADLLAGDFGFLKRRKDTNASALTRKAKR